MPVPPMWSICCPAIERRLYKRLPNYPRSVQLQWDECRMRERLNASMCGHATLDDVLALVFRCVPRTIESMQMDVWPYAAFQRLVSIVLDVHQPPVSPSIRPHKRPKIGRNTKRTPKRRQTSRCAVDLDGKRPNRN